MASVPIPPAALAVTTSDKPSASLVDEARRKAAKWGLPFVPRAQIQGPGEPGSPGTPSRAIEALLVVGRDGVVLWDATGRLAFHAGMAHLRRLRMDRDPSGGDDAMLRAAQLGPGERVLDCTLGLAQDALVAARAVGPGGRVVGLEASLALYAVVSDGLERFDSGPRACAVEAVHADAAAYLRSLPNKAFDVVLFDPMFERPRRAQPAFEILRRHALHAPLDRTTLDEARRVAGRRVVVKGSRYSSDLSRLGLTPLAGSRYATVVWAVATPIAADE